MPLLGRHKSLPTAARNPAPVAADSAASIQQQQQQHLVCKSPLFGIRRQLPIASSASNATNRDTINHTPVGSGSSNKPHGKVIKSYSGSSGAGSGANTANNRQNTANKTTTTQDHNNTQHELGSIPQQITSQQIHYAFSIMDTNSDGLIDLRDMSQMLANLGVPIDEAILSHVISGVSKRGDHFISEREFLTWISDFIQINDSPPAVASNQNQSHSNQANRNSNKTTNKSSSTQIVRSPTAGSSLAAGQPEAAVAPGNLRFRRGSGSGLALMRSLSSGSGSGNKSGSATDNNNNNSINSNNNNNNHGNSTTGNKDSSPANQSGACNTNTKNTNKQSSSAKKTPNESEESRLDDLETQNDLRAAFCVFDLDGDGFITLDEVQAGLKLLGETWSQAELQQVFNSCASTSSISKLSPSSTSTGKLGQSGGNKSNKKQMANMPINHAAAATNKQQISIDDFVRLLL